jgi:hypothetical protein
MQSPQTILTQVLTIINYPNDKDAFIQEFGDTCIKSGLKEVTETLSPEKRDELFAKIQNVSDTAQAEAIIGQYVNITDYQEAVQNATSTLFENFLTEIEPELTDEQADALDTYLASLHETGDQSSIE